MLKAVIDEDGMLTLKRLPDTEEKCKSIDSEKKALVHKLATMLEPHKKVKK